MKCGRKNERDDRAPWGHVNKDSLFHSLPFFLAPSMSVHSSLPSPDDSTEQPDHCFTLWRFPPSCPTPPMLAPFLSLSPVPSFHVSYLLLVCFSPPSLFEPSGHRSAQCQERKGDAVRGGRVRGGGEVGGREIEERSRMTERKSQEIKLFIHLIILALKKHSTNFIACLLVCVFLF